MLRRPPRSTRTDTPFPYTTLFRSAARLVGGRRAPEIPLLVARRIRFAPDRRDHVEVEFIQPVDVLRLVDEARSEEHTSELQSLMRSSYAVFCLKKKKKHTCTILY